VRLAFRDPEQVKEWAIIVSWPARASAPLPGASRPGIMPDIGTAGVATGLACPVAAAAYSPRRPGRRSPIGVSAVQLSAKQVERVIEKLGGFGETSPCEVCQSTSWVVNVSVFELREYHPQTFDPAGKIIPVVVTQCSKCGYLRTFSAVALGVVDPQTGGPADG
jgi:hypothetical protein